MPLLSAFRTLAIGTLLGPQKERQVNWYLESAHLEKLLSQLTPQLEKLAQIIQHYAISVCHSLGLVLTFFFVIVNTGRLGWGYLCVSDLIFKQALVVIQDMLRVLIIRIACQNADNASLLLQPILSWIRDCVSEPSSPSDTDAYKVNISVTITV